MGTGILPLGIALSLTYDWRAAEVLLVGLSIVGDLFAVNSSLDSYLIVNYLGEEGVSLGVGFYCMDNAMGRLADVVLSGW